MRAFVRLALAVSGLFLRAEDYFVDPIARGASPLALLLAGVVWLALTTAPVTSREGAVGFVGAAVAGVPGAVSWVVAPTEWVMIVVAVASRAVLARVPRREALALSAVIAVPALLVVGTLAPGRGDAHRVIVRATLDALPPTPVLVERAALVAACLWTTRYAERALRPITVGVAFRRSPLKDHRSQK